MATPDDRPRRNSDETGTAGTKVPGFLPPAWPQMPEGAARAGFTAFDLMDSWLTASRQMMDLWRTAVREQQDCMVAAFRQHIANAAPDELVDELSETARSTHRSARTRQDEPAHTHH